MKQHNARWSCRLARGAALAAALSAVTGSTAALAHDGEKPLRRPAVSAVREELTAGGFRFNNRFRHRNVPPPAPGGPGNTSAPYLPPGVQETYPYAPFQHPDILRNYLQMRATSPNPNQFMGGVFNPQYRSVAPPPSYLDPYYPYPEPYYPPVDYGYGGYSYGGYIQGPIGGIPALPSLYSTYGNWYPQAVPQNRVVIQREVIYVQPDARSGVKAQEAKEDYYLTRPKAAETLNDAIEEIRRAWLNGDFPRFQARVSNEAKVRIHLKGKYQYSVKGEEFTQMTRDAMTRIDTTAFELDRVTKQGEDRAFASGKHTYVDPEKNKREVYVSYGLERVGGKWKITEAGSSTNPITQHAE